MKSHNSPGVPPCHPPIPKFLHPIWMDRVGTPGSWKGALIGAAIATGLMTPPALSAISDSVQVAAADAPDGSDQAPGDQAEGVDAGSRFSVELGAVYVNKYYFRGIIQEDHGLIVQPWLTLGVSLVDDDDLSIDAYAGGWASLHGDTDTAGADSSLPNWYELDLFAGVTFGLGSFSVDLSYVAYTSPSDAFDTIEEIIVAFGFDDADAPLLGGLALNPSALVAFEIGDDAADGGETGVYVQFGIAPSHTYQTEGFLDGLTLSLPITVGLSADNYYEDAGDDDTFGFFDIGIDADVPVVTGSGFGTVSVFAGLHWLLLGDHTEVYNDGDDSELVASFGVSVAF